MIEQLYQKRENSNKDGDKVNREKVMEQMQDKKTRIYRQKFNECLPKDCIQKLLCIRVCKLSKEERLFKRARETFENEIDIVKFLKKIRTFETFQKKVTAQLELNMA